MYMQAHFNCVFHYVLLQCASLSLGKVFVASTYHMNLFWSRFMCRCNNFELSPQLRDQQLTSFLGDAEDVTYCVAVPPHLFVTTSADGCVRQYNSSTKRREWRKNFGASRRRLLTLKSSTFISFFTGRHHMCIF